jgi:hypothetical protein
VKRGNMRIELYLVPDDENGRLIKEFLINNNLPFKEIISNNINELENISKLRIIRNHAIIVCDGFNELFLNQELIEHIKKYKPRVE